MATVAGKTVYLMIKDIDGQVGIDWGVDWGLDDGEELPEDCEDLTNAQYTVWMCVKAIRGVGDDAYRAEVKKQANEKPSGLLVPVGNSESG